jgi:hypothetical protein
MQSSMNLRATLSDKPIRAVAIAAGLLLVGLAIIVSQLRSASAPVSRSQAFFTIDDGKTWFADDAGKLPPFDKDGKQAVRAYVFRSAAGAEFVNHLERFKPDAKRAIEEANKPDPNQKAAGPPKHLAAIQSAYTGGREVKRPGDAKWVGTGDFRDAAQIMAVKCPDGGTEALPIEP